VRAHLQGRPGQLRQGLAVDERDTTDREDPVLAGDLQIGANPDAAAGGLWQAPVTGCLEAATPAAQTVMSLARAVPSASTTIAGNYLGNGGAGPDLPECGSGAGRA
jgi:hypothetical protein